MRLTLRQLQIFAAVADTGSTTAAATQVALSQSAISGALNELENLLDAQLFDRIGRRLLLNDSGRALLPQARALLDGAEDIEQQFGASAGSGMAARLQTRLRIGASTTIGNYLLPAIVAAYRQSWPDARVEVHIGNTQAMAASLERLEVDMALIEGPCHEPALQVTPWIEDDLVIVGAPSHPLVQQHVGSRMPLRVLRQAPWLLREPGSGTRETVEQLLLPHLHHFTDEMQFGSTEAIKQAAVERLGLACLSLCAVEDLVALGRLAILETTLPRLTRRFYLVHHRQKRFSASLERFAAHCTSALPVRTPAFPASR